jgi:7-carboxy-7-deazaguanine synthase
MNFQYTTQMSDPTKPRIPDTREDMLKVTEIFHSLQGEARDAGRPTVFIRLTGCPLRCQYCDSEYAFFGGEWMSFDEIMETVETHGTRHVCVTGGEPLAQKRCTELLTRLCEAGYSVSLETSGAIDISNVDPRVSRVLDLKTPGSGEEARNLWSNLVHLTNHDQIKFVIRSGDDYQWAKEQLEQRNLTDNCDVLFSPSWGQMDATVLAENVLEDQLPVRVQLQMHKLLWGDIPGK